MANRDRERRSTIRHSPFAVRPLQGDTPIAPPPVIRLHPEDGVVIARRACRPARRSPPASPRRPRPGRPQGRDPAARQGRAGAPLRPDHRLRDRAMAPGQHVHMQNAAWATSRWTTPTASTPSRAELRSARDLPGHPPRRRAGGDAQLHRHPDLGELLRPRRRHHRRHSAATPSPARTRWPISRTSTASWR